MSKGCQDEVSPQEMWRLALANQLVRQKAKQQPGNCADAFVRNSLQAPISRKLDRTEWGGLSLLLRVR
jgi:hypothetical protein